MEDRRVSIILTQFSPASEKHSWIVDKWTKMLLQSFRPPKGSPSNSQSSSRFLWSLIKLDLPFCNFSIDSYFNHFIIYLFIVKIYIIINLRKPQHDQNAITRSNFSFYNQSNLPQSPLCYLTAQFRNNTKYFGEITINLLPPIVRKISRLIPAL